MDDFDPQSYSYWWMCLVQVTCIQNLSKQILLWTSPANPALNLCSFPSVPSDSNRVPHSSLILERTRTGAGQVRPKFSGGKRLRKNFAFGYCQADFFAQLFQKKSIFFGSRKVSLNWVKASYFRDPCWDPWQKCVEICLWSRVHEASSICRFFREQTNRQTTHKRAQVI